MADHAERARGAESLQSRSSFAVKRRAPNGAPHAGMPAPLAAAVAAVRTIRPAGRQRPIGLTSALAWNYTLDAMPIAGARPSLPSAPAMLASLSVFRIPARWREVDLPVRLEISHLVLHIVKRRLARHAPPVCLPADGTQNDVVRLPRADRIGEHPVQFRLVGHQRLAPKTESTRLVEQNKPEAIYMNHQRQFTNIRSRLAARTARETSTSVGI
jgi:hypothetical protein